MIFMPWEVKTVEKTRSEFVTEALAHEISFSALCRKYEITRKTGLKWLERFNNGQALIDQCRAPFHTPNKTCMDTENLILQARHEHPAWGPRKLKKLLENQGHTMLPAISTFAEILKRNGLISKEDSLAHKPFKRFQKDSPNDLWQTDFKGHFAMKDGVRCYPLTVLDDHSRYSLCIDAKLNEQGIGVFKSFQRLFKEYGLPEAILCDNGNPWGNSQRTGYTKFEVWLMQLGIQPIHGRSFHPQTQGKEERFHRTMVAELLKYTEILDISNAQVQFDAWRHQYNHIRPHEALNMRVPADVYCASIKKIPDKINPFDYGHHENRVVNAKGYFSYKSRSYYLSEAFADEIISIVPSSKDGFVKIQYRNFYIGRINLAERMIVSKKIYPV